MCVTHSEQKHAKYGSRFSRNTNSPVFQYKNGIPLLNIFSRSCPYFTKFPKWANLWVSSFGMSQHLSLGATGARKRDSLGVCMLQWNHPFLHNPKAYRVALTEGCQMHVFFIDYLSLRPNILLFLLRQLIFMDSEETDCDKILAAHN